ARPAGRRQGVVEGVAPAYLRPIQRQPQHGRAELVPVSAGDARLRQPRPAERHSARRNGEAFGHRPYGALDRARRARSNSGRLLSHRRAAMAALAGALQRGDALAQASDAPRGIAGMQDTLAGSLAQVFDRAAQLRFRSRRILAIDRFADFADVALDARPHDAVAVVPLLVLAVALDRGLVTICQGVSSWLGTVTPNMRARVGQFTKGPRVRGSKGPSLP